MWEKGRKGNAWKGSLIGGNAHREIMFRNGYGKDSPSFVAKCTLSVGEGKEELGAEPGKKYFVLTIHKIIWKSMDNLGGYMQKSLER